MALSSLGFKFPWQPGGQKSIRAGLPERGADPASCPQQPGTVIYNRGSPYLLTFSWDQPSNVISISPAVHCEQTPLCVASRQARWKQDVDPWILRVDPVPCELGGGGVRLGEDTTVTPVALLPGMQMFRTILGSSFIYNIGLPSLGLLQRVPIPSQRERRAGNLEELCRCHPYQAAQWRQVPTIRLISQLLVDGFSHWTPELPPVVLGRAEQGKGQTPSLVIHSTIWLDLY